MKEGSSKVVAQDQEEEEEEEDLYFEMEFPVRLVKIRDLAHG